MKMSEKEYIIRFKDGKSIRTTISDRTFENIVDLTVKQTLKVLFKLNNL
jgi:hypothetical protein